jgi:hypothetical protein
VIVLADTDAVLKALESLGPILWEEGQEGRIGWAICPCCGKRDLRVQITKVKVLQVEDDEA